MEENQGTQTQGAQSPVGSPSGVSFPSVSQPQKSGGPKILLVLGILVLLGILGFVIYKNSSTAPEPEETSGVLSQNTGFEPTPVPSPTATAKPADKSKIKIEVQNGTGITGEAAYLQNQLKSLGYTSVTVGNAESQDETATTVTFSKTLSADIVDELTKKLKDLYKEVEVKTSSTLKTDAVIVTGLKKGATAKASASPTPRASATGTPRATTTATPTPTPTST